MENKTIQRNTPTAGELSDDELDAVVGGIGGSVGYYAESPQITNCYNSVGVSRNTSSAGGILGYGNSGIVSCIRCENCGMQHSRDTLCPNCGQ